MPFGKYRGTPVEDLPLDYARWLWDNVELFGGLKDEIERLLQDDQDDDAAVINPMDAIRPVYRRMAQKYHPDKGGDVAAMQAVNDFYQELIGEFARIGI